MEDIKRHINAIDFEPILGRLMKRQRWALNEALKACEQYKNYLFLVKKYGNQYILPPSIDIDEVWHEHILNTKLYHSDCLKIFGKYLHHSPESPDQIINNEMGSSIDYFTENTQKLYYQEFNEFITPILETTFLKQAMESITKFISIKKPLG